MSFNRHARKKDANHAELVELFRKHGAYVIELERPVDLLIGYRRRWFTVEIKNPQGRNREQPAQIHHRQNCEHFGLPHYVLHSTDAISPTLDDLVKRYETKSPYKV